METSNGNDTTILMQNLEEWRQRCSFLEQEKAELNNSFEQKRVKFNEIYQAKEKLVAEQNAKLEAMQNKMTDNEDTVAKMQIEIDDIKMIASVSENTKQEAVENLNKRHQDEIESLRKAMEDSNEESQRDMVRHFDRERRQWERKLSTLTSERENLKLELEDVQKRIHHGDLSEEEELEESMKKAHAEAEKLKSVVLPLEGEISKLKVELSETQNQLRTAQQAAQDLNLKSTKEINEATKTTDTEDASDIDTIPMLELDQSLKCEKSSRTDLEMYVEVLQQQKKEVEEETLNLKEKLRNVCKHYEVEKAEHAVLKETWLAANDQFLESQRLLMRDNNIIEGVLSEDQRRQVKMLKLKAQASEARDAPAKSPMSSHALLKKKTEKFKEAVADSFSAKSDTESDSQSFGSFQDFQEATESDQQKFTDGLTLKLNLPLRNEPSVKLMPEAEQIDADMIVPGPGQKVVSELQWRELQQEVRMLRKKLSKDDTADSKHADLFDDDLKMIAEIESLKGHIKTIQAEKEKQSHKTKSLEESIQCSAEDAQKQISELTEKLLDFERLVGKLKEKSIKAKADDINKLLDLTKHRDKLREDVILIKKERDKLLMLQEKHQQNLAKENVSMPKTIEGMRNLVKMYREALATSRAEHEHTQTKLQNEIAFLQDRLKVEQCMKEQLESSLASELHDARGEIISLQSLRSVKDELSEALKENEELENEIEKRKMSVEAIRSKSNEIIKGLREKQLAEIKAKEDVERTLSETQNRLRSLQSALATSELVQRDFVRLSQSLQVQLEGIREEREQEERERASFAGSETGSIHSLDLAAPSHSGCNTPDKTNASPKIDKKNELKKTKSAAS